MPKRDGSVPDGSVKVTFTRPNSKGWVFVPANDLERARQMVAPMLITVPDDATWTTEPPTPGILPPEKEAASV